MQALALVQSRTDLATHFSQDEIQAAKLLLQNQVADSTKRAYASDWRLFSTYCASKGVQALPAAPEVVALFLGEESRKGVKYSTISRRAAAINFAHETAELESPTKAKAVSGMLQGIRRTVGAAPTKKAPATSAKLKELVRLCPDTLQGKRDRALLLVGFAGAFRRSELVGLQVADIQVEQAGMRVVIRKSKTDQYGEGQTIGIARGEVFCPVQALQDYLAAAQITEGPIFRPVTKYGTLRKEALSTKSVADIIKAYAARAGFDATEFAGHSLRSGFLTSAAEAGANVFKMIEVSRHKSLETVRGYVRNAEVFKNHAGAGLL